MVGGNPEPFDPVFAKGLFGTTWTALELAAEVECGYIIMVIAARPTNVATSVTCFWSFFIMGSLFVDVKSRFSK